MGIGKMETRVNANGGQSGRRILPDPAKPDFLGVGAQQVLPSYVGGLRRRLLAFISVVLAEASPLRGGALPFSVALRIVA